MQTFIKCAGNKRKLAPQLAEWAPNDIDVYAEPFVGSASVFFAMAEAGKLQIESAHLNDINTYLIKTLRAAAKIPMELIDDTNALLAQHDKEHYYKVRANRPELASDVAAWFLYLNRTCFNGLYRENSKGEFNVPIGSYKNPSLAQLDIIEAHNLFHKFVRRFYRVDFSEFLAILSPQLTPQSFIYFDPPYAKKEGASFTKYTRSDFTHNDQVRLAEVIKLLTSEGVRIMLSNSAVDSVYELYPSNTFTIREVQMARRINSDTSNRKAVKELVITNYEDSANARVGLPKTA